MIRFEIHGDNLTITDAIRNYIEEKVGKLERYFNNVPNAVAHVRVKTYSNSTTKIEVTIPLKDVTLRAEERHDDLESTANNQADDIESENDIEIIRSKQFSLKPMDSEEAVLQMNLLGHDFFIFTDRETDGTSIVYRRKDGKYGLIETTE